MSLPPDMARAPEIAHKLKNKKSRNFSLPFARSITPTNPEDQIARARASMEHHQQCYEIIAAKAEDNPSDSDEEPIPVAKTGFFKRNTPSSVTSRAGAKAAYHQNAREEREEHGKATCEALALLERRRRTNGYYTPKAEAERRQHIEKALALAQADGWRRDNKYYLDKVNAERTLAADEKAMTQSTQTILANDTAANAGYDRGYMIAHRHAKDLVKATSERYRLATDRINQADHENRANNNTFAQTHSQRRRTDTNFKGSQQIDSEGPTNVNSADRSASDGGYKLVCGRDADGSYVNHYERQSDSQLATDNFVAPADHELHANNAAVAITSERRLPDTNFVRPDQFESEPLGTEPNLARSGQGIAEHRLPTTDEFAVHGNHGLLSRNALGAGYERCTRLSGADSEHRRTEASFPRHDIGHSTATVAGSRLTASVSCNDLSQPTPKPDRSRFALLKREKESLRPSRIPSPIGEGVSPTRRYASTPVLPSQQVKKEDVPSKTHRLLRPVSPSAVQPQIPLPRSRTMGFLGTLNNTFSRSSLSLHSNRSNSSVTRTGDPTVSISNSASPPVPTFTTSICQIHTTQENAYWCGRFSALLNEYKQQAHDRCMKDSKYLQRYIPKAWDPKKARFLVLKHKLANAGKEEPGVDMSEAKHEFLRKSQEEVDNFMAKEEQEQILKVLRTLEQWCVTTEAKRSFWSWQLTFARFRKEEKYLPVRGRMVAVPEVPDEPYVPEMPEVKALSHVGRLFAGAGNVSSASLPQQGEEGVAVTILKKKRSLPEMSGLRERAGNEMYQRKNEPLE